MKQRGFAVAWGVLTLLVFLLPAVPAGSHDLEQQHALPGPAELPWLELPPRPGASLPGALASQEPDLNWTTQLVDAQRSFVNVSRRSLAVDSRGRPHLVYGGAHLFHAWRDGDTWHTEVVDGGGAQATLVLDADDHPHISYFNEVGQSGDPGLKYAAFDGRAWHIESVEVGETVGYEPSLALDAAGRPHIAYIIYSGYQLKYASYDGSAWQIAVVDSAADMPSLALDSLGRPHIMYCRNSSSWCDGLLHAYDDGTSWQIETVDGSDQAGYWNSLAIDANDGLHVSYMDGTNYNLKYARYNGSFSVVLTATNGCGWTGLRRTLVVAPLPRREWSIYLPCVMRLWYGRR
jgi:hypothetical protein